MNFIIGHEAKSYYKVDGLGGAGNFIEPRRQRRYEIRPT